MPPRVLKSSKAGRVSLDKWKTWRDCSTWFKISFVQWKFPLIPQTKFHKKAHIADITKLGNISKIRARQTVHDCQLAAMDTDHMAVHMGKVLAMSYPCPQGSLLSCANVADQKYRTLLEWCLVVCMLSYRFGLFLFISILYFYFALCNAAFVTTWNFCFVVLFCTFSSLWLMTNIQKYSYQGLLIIQ